MRRVVLLLTLVFASAAAHAQNALQRDYSGAEAAALQLLKENIRLFGPDHANVGTA